MKQALVAVGCLMIGVVLVVLVVLARRVMPGTSKVSPAVFSSWSGAAPSAGTTMGSQQTWTSTEPS